MSKRNDEEQKASPPRRRSKLGCLYRLFRMLFILLCLGAAACIFIPPLGESFGAGLISVDEPAKADYIVVLGGKADRAVEAARLYRDGYAPKVILSSGGRHLQDLYKVAQAFGVPEKDIICDDQAVRTSSHPHTVAALKGVDKHDSLLIVTSPLHTSRSRACFLRAGYTDVRMLCPCWQRGGALGPRHESYGQRAGNFINVIYESLAWGMYWIFRWV